MSRSMCLLWNQLYLTEWYFAIRALQAALIYFLCEVDRNLTYIGYLSSGPYRIGVLRETHVIGELSSHFFLLINK